MKTIIIQGSARHNGNTSKIANILAKDLKADVIDLCKKNIHSYSYTHEHMEDDFFPLIRSVVEYDLIVFLSPVYWYTMSGLMKNFLDRITDCLKVEKETGRKLRGKAMAVVSCGSESIATEGFFIPFTLSASYLGMRNLGNLHTYLDEKSPNEQVLKSLEQFSQKLKREV